MVIKRPRLARSYGRLSATRNAMSRGNVAAIAAYLGKSAYNAMNVKGKSRVTGGVRKVVRRRKIGQSATVMTRTKKKVMENHSTENRFRALTVNARKPSAYSLASMSLEPAWFRVQGITQYDTNTGFYGIRQLINASGFQMMPLHVWDLTAHPNDVSGTYTEPNVGYYCYKTATTAGADVVFAPIPEGSQNAAGVATSSNTALVAENISDASFASAKANSLRKAFHHWSHIKMNLYGVRKRATRYVVQLMMVKQEFADFISAAQSNNEKRKLVDYLVRPFIFSNLQQGDCQTIKDIRILKTYEVIIDPITTDEYSGATSTPHIQTLNWFVNHNRVRRYDWLRAGAGVTTNSAAYDAENPVALSTTVDPSSRVYLVVRALAPEATSAEFNTAIDPISQPSYDLILRQKFSDPQ